MTKPIVAITSDYKEVAPYMWHAAPAPYIEAAAHVSQVVPLIVPSLGHDLEIDALRRVELATQPAPHITAFGGGGGAGGSGSSGSP